MKKLINKVLLLLLVAFVGISLTACDNNNVDTTNKNVPYGPITNDVYATVGTYELTTKALYDKFRANGYDYLFDEMIKKIVNKTQGNVTVEGNEEAINKIIDENCYGTAKKEDLNSATKQKYLDKFADQMKLVNVEVTATEEGIYSTSAQNYFLTKLKQKLFVEKDILRNSNSKYYYENEFQKENGEEILDENGEKILNPYYISEDAKKSTHTSEENTNGEYTVIIIGYPTYQEASDALANYSTKVANNELTVSDFEAMYKARYESIYGGVNNVPTDFTFTDKELSAYDSGLVSMIKNMKKDKYMLLQQFGKNVYSVYLVNEKPEVDEDVELTADEAKAAVDKIIENKLTTSVISSLLVEQIYDLEVTIYDPLFDALYATENPNHKRLEASAWQDSYKDLLVKFGEHTISVKEFYDVVEPLLGLTTAMDYFTTQTLLNHADFADKLSDEEKNVDKEFNSIITSFRNGTLASSGYPTSLGEENFKLAYFGTASDEEIKAQLKANKIWKKYVSEKDDKYFDYAETFSKNYFEKYFDLSVKHILLTVDFNADGNPDDPELYIKKNSIDETTFKNTVTSTMKAIVKEIHTVMEENGSTLLDTLTYVKKQFYTNETLESDNTLTWSDLRGTYNFGLTVEDLSSVNSSNASQYVKEFGAGVSKLYNHLKTNNLLDEDYLIPTDEIEYSDLIPTNYGYHLLGIYDSGSAPSAKYVSNSDKDQYKEIKIELNGKPHTLNAYSDQRWALKNQIMIYEAQVNTDDGVTDLPSAVKNYISKFYSEFSNRYANDSFKNILFAVSYLDIDFDEESSFDENKLTTFINIQKAKFDNYEDYSSTSNSFLAGWWEIVLPQASNKQ